MSRYIVVAISNVRETDLGPQVWSQEFNSEMAADQCATWLSSIHLDIRATVFVDNPDTDE